MRNILARTPIWNQGKKVASILVIGLLSLPFTVLAEENTRMASAVPSATSVLKIGLMLVVVILMFFAFAWILRRMNGMHPQGSGILKITAGISVGQRERLAIVEVDGQRLLIGVTPHNIQTLHVLGEAQAPTSSASSSSPSFKESFRHVLSKGGRP